MSRPKCVWPIGKPKTSIPITSKPKYLPIFATISTVLTRFKLPPFLIPCSNPWGWAIAMSLVSATSSDRAGRAAKEHAAIFVAGKLDRFQEIREANKDQCIGAAYRAFPELEALRHH